MADLYCIGCGVRVCEARPGRVLAIACTCGASAPILQNDSNGRYATPVSLVRATFGQGRPMHLEHYLGFSGHHSLLKDRITQQLRALGAISFTECDDQKCRAGYERAKLRWEERERRARIAEIGES